MSKFIVIEGIDASGKGTQVNALYKHYTVLGKKVVKLSAINSESSIGKVIRHILKTPSEYVSDVHIMNLFMAELQTTASDINKLLDKDYLVICDRWYYSTLAYNGVTDELFNAVEIMCDTLPIPDLVVNLDVSIDVALERIRSRSLLPELYETADKLIAVKDGYDIAYANTQAKVVNVDSTLPVSAVNYIILKEIETL